MNSVRRQALFGTRWIINICHVKIAKIFGTGVRGSVVERVPDKNEVHGSIPCAPTQFDSNQLP